jgi:TctA family transporter
MIFLKRPISVVLLSIAALIFVSPILAFFFKRERAVILPKEGEFDDE